MRILALAALAPLVIAAAPPTDAETTKDVQCLVAVASLAGSDDKDAKMAAAIGSQYFLGRIDGRSPNLDLEAAIKLEASRLGEAQMRSLLQSCGQLMQSRGKALQEIGERMQAEEGSQSPPAT